MSTFADVHPPPDLTRFIVKSGNQYSNSGSFGDVYKCWYHCDGATPKQVAVKAFRFKLIGESAAGERSNKMVRRELGIWRRLNHENIVPFLGITYGFGMEGSVSLVSLWMSNDTLLKFLEKYDHRLSVEHRLQLLLDVANGLDYLHSYSIVHGDLNCNNILLDENYTARLADFGYASLVGNIPEALTYLELSTIRPGAIRWAAPEQILPRAAGFRLTTSSDIYSFGCISLQVLSGKKPWSEVEKDTHVVLCVAQGRKPGRPDTQSQRAMDDRHWDFIQRCWSSVQERLSAKEVIVSIQEFLSYHPQLYDLFTSSVTQPDRLVDPSATPISRPLDLTSHDAPEPSQLPTRLLFTDSSPTEPTVGPPPTLTALTGFSLWAEGMSTLTVPVDTLLSCTQTSAPPASVVLRFKVHLPPINIHFLLALNGVQSCLTCTVCPCAEVRCSTVVLVRGERIHNESNLCTLMSVNPTGHYQHQSATFLLPDSPLTHSRWLDSATPTSIVQKISVDEAVLAIIYYDLDWKEDDTPAAKFIGLQSYHDPPALRRNPQSACQ